MSTFFNDLFGLDKAGEHLTLLNLVARAFLVYFAGMFLLRIQSQFMSINTSFNYMLNFIVGSLLAAAIVGEGPYFPVVIMTFFIALMNWFIAFLCFYSPTLETFFKGETDILAKNGRIMWKNMRKNLITEEELMEAVHKSQASKLSEVKIAYFEDSGEITVIAKKKR